MAKVQKGSFMNAILDQKKSSLKDQSGLNHSKSDHTQIEKDTYNAYNEDDTHITENTQNMYNEDSANYAHSTPVNGISETAREKRKLTRLNLALDAQLLLDMEDLAIVKGKKSLTALLTEVMGREIADNMNKINAYRQIKGQ